MATMVKLKQGTQEWLDWRNNGITATEAACITGKSKWGTPLSVYEQKLNPQPHEPSKYEEWGTLLEDTIKFGKFAKMHPEFEVRQGECYEDEWRKCSLDGELWRDGKCEAILEIKTGRNINDWDPIPEYYKAQVMWQMHVTGIHKVYFAVLINGCDYFEREIEYDPNYCEHLELICYQFWYDNVLERTAPPASNPDIDQSIVEGTALKTGAGTVYEVPENDVITYLALKTKAEDIEYKLKMAKLKLTEYFKFGQHLTFKGKNFGTMVTVKGRESIDKKLLQERYPDIYAEVLKTGKPISYPKFG